MHQRRPRAKRPPAPIAHEHEHKQPHAVTTFVGCVAYLGPLWGLRALDHWPCLSVLWSPLPLAVSLSALSGCMQCLLLSKPGRGVQPPSSPLLSPPLLSC